MIEFSRTSTCVVMQASDQAALKALTGPVDVEETRDGEPSESRSIKSMKDSSGSALEVSVQGETSQVMILLPFPTGFTRI